MPVSEDNQCTPWRPNLEGSLTKKAKALLLAYGGEGETFVLNLTEAKVEGFGSVLATLTDVLNKTLAAVQE